jgi:hypothetical protein
MLELLVVIGVDRLRECLNQTLVSLASYIMCVCGGGGGRCNTILACDDLIADECIFEACLLNIFCISSVRILLFTALVCTFYASFNRISE